MIQSVHRSHAGWWRFTPFGRASALRRLAAVVESSAIPIASVDLQGRTTLFNAANARLSGYSAAELLGKPFAIFPPEQVERQIALTLERGSYSAELTLIARDGHSVPVFVTTFPLRDRKGRVVEIAGIALDITERKERLRKLAESEQRFRALAEVTAEILWVAHPDGTLGDPSPSWLAFSGQTREEALAEGLGWINFVHPDDRAYVRETWAASIRETKPFHAEYRFRRHDGVYRHVEARGGPVFNEDGSVREWVGMSFDVTERKEAEAERARLYEEAKAALALRDEFLSIASHELLTPLTPLLARVQLLDRCIREEPSDRARIEELVQSTRSQIRRLARLIRSLLDVSLLQRGQLKLDCEPSVDLVALVHRVCRRAEDEAAQAGCRLQIESDGPFYGTWDRPRVELMVEHLLSNALKFGGGKPIEITVAREGDRAILTVRDHGFGMDAGQQQRLFGLYERGVPSRHYGGLGLGLFVVREIVEAHGGSVTVHSAPGMGSVFRIELPLDQCGQLNTAFLR